MNFVRVLETAGDGHWSNVSKAVRTTRLDIPYVNEEGDFGELRVHFDTDDWNINQDGLIYTDDQFIKELRKSLTLIGLPGDDASYSEQGMQGDDYVSLDIGQAFIDAWREKL